MKTPSWLLLGVCAACGPAQPPENPASPAGTDSVAAVAPPAPAPVDDFLNPAWFKMARQDTFRVTTRTGPEGGFDLGTGKLIKLTASQEKRYLQGKTRPRAQREIAPYYFYSLQQNTPQRQEITILHDDGEFLFELLRLVYDARHQLISRETVAHFGADGGELTRAYGVFETPTQFRLTALHEGVTGEDSVATQSEIDSVVTLYAVEADKFRQVGRSRYQRHKTKPLGQ
ncbi:hypothetical protein [Hymenobacter cellulosivorans]|uniref:Uncharacterized protein n=1 Tax=Hymenobacter cellulosivorans TaxID=2932249 RepID=A0ABY4F9U3_9BACT|nr:hypothetical protein [Hymenobacter cellulosivorans]UOQ52872.1 hypothetical protein MUN80_24410 [Hymenobacter cellulosivorans]